MSKIIEAARQAAMNVRVAKWGQYFNTLVRLIDAVLADAGGIPEDYQSVGDGIDTDNSFVLLPSDGLKFRLKDGTLQVQAWDEAHTEWAWRTVKSLAEIGELCFEAPAQEVAA